MPQFADCVSKLNYRGLTCRPNAKGLKNVLTNASMTNSTVNGTKLGGLPTIMAETEMMIMGAKPAKKTKPFLFKGYLPCSFSARKPEELSHAKFHINV